MDSLLLLERICLLMIILTSMQNATLSLTGKKCEKSTYQNLASKSAYRLLKNKPKHPIKYPGCEPAQVYFVARHGSRYPSSKMITKLINGLPQLRDAIVQSAEEGKGNLCQQDVVLLKNWTLDMKSSSGHTLVKEGATELQDIGTTLRFQFQLFWKEYSPLDYWFFSTIEKRAIESATNFSSGLFPNVEDIEKYIIQNNTLLRLYKRCEKWIKEVKNNSKREKQHFLHNGTEISYLISSVTKRLGLEKVLTLDEIQLIYTICQFHTALVRPNEGSTSVWCHMLSTQELQILEYADDLNTYWKDGYGFLLTRYLACPVIEDIITRFRTFTEFTDESQMTVKPPIGTFHFTHSGMLLKLLTALGLFEDDVPLLSSNYKHQSKRKWRTSYIDPFASNLQLVLFKCISENDQRSEFRVAAYVQQQEVLLPNCTSILCPLDRFFENYEHYLDSCNIQDLCEYSASIDNHNIGYFKQNYQANAGMILITCITAAISIIYFLCKTKVQW